MINAVLMFGALNTLFEFVLLTMIAPRWRLRLLGNDSACTAVHMFFLGANLVIHWGTLVGTMSGVLAFVTSMATLRCARFVFGTIKDDRYYRVGLIRYRSEDLK